MGRECYIQLKVFYLLAFLCLSGVVCDDGGPSLSNTSLLNTNLTEIISHLNTNLTEINSHLGTNLTDTISHLGTNLTDIISHLGTNLTDKSLLSTNLTKLISHLGTNLTDTISSMISTFNTSETSFDEEGLEAMKTKCAELKAQLIVQMNKTIGIIDGLVNNPENDTGTSDDIKNSTDNAFHTQMLELINAMQNELQKSCELPENLQVPSLAEEQAVLLIHSIKDDPKKIFEALKPLNKDELKSLLKLVNNQQWTMYPQMATVVAAIGKQFIKPLGGIRRLSLQDFKDMGKSAIFMIPANAIKSLSDSVFEYFIDQMAFASKVSVERGLQEMQQQPNCTSEQCHSEDQQVNKDSTREHNSTDPGSNIPQSDHSLVPVFMMGNNQHIRLKAICQRLFQKYSSPKNLNSNWNRVKYLMFCAPTPACQKIKPALVHEDRILLSIMPWACGKALQSPMANEQGEGGAPLNDDLRQVVQRLFPSNKPCGMTLVSKMVAGKNSRLYPITSADDLKSLGTFSLCVSDRRIKSAIDSVGCDLGNEIVKFGEFSKWVNNYAARKCLTLPEKIDNITCDTLEQSYGQFLPMLKSDFFKQLNQSVLCDKVCISSFKSHGVASNMMNFIVDKCYGKEVPITADVVANLGAMVTDLPMEKFDQISAADLESNLDSIKMGLKKSKKGRGGSKKRAVMGKLARKMIDDGKISAIVDSKEIMKQVSLKELKTSLSSSNDLLTDLGITNSSSDVAMTNSQKKWVVKELLKKKSSDAMTLADISGMSGLVTGLLSSNIKQIGSSNKTDVELIDFAKVMCSYNNWPTKSLKAINKHLINKALEYRNATNLMASLTMMDVEAIGCECFMHFSAEDYGAMDSEVCSGVCQKIGYCSNFRCLNPRRRKNTLQACLKCKGLGSTPMSDTDIDELGPSLISQMSKQQIDLVPATVISSRLQFFKEMCMNKILRDAVSDALPRAIGSQGSDYTSDVLYLLGGAIKLLPSSILQQLDLGILAEMTTSILDEIIPKGEDAIKLKKCCKQWLPSEDLDDLSRLDFNLMLTLKQAIFARAATESTRRRRSSSSWTCSFIKQSPELFYTATETEIADMENTEFVECLTDIGQLSDYNTSQKDALLAKSKTALNESDICNIPVSDVVSLGSILTSLSTDEINCLPLNDSNLMTSIGSTSGWVTNQLDAIATRYVASNSLTDLSGITESDIGLLGPILCGFNASQIATIPSAEIGKSGTVVGALMCDVAILSEFAKLAVAVDAFGPVSGWDAAEVSELNYLIAGLTGAEIATLTVSALEGLDAAVIPKIPASVFKDMSTTQLESFTDAQSTAVSADQIAELSEEQKTLLNNQSTGGLEDVPEVQMNNDTGSWPCSTIRQSPASFYTATETEIADMVDTEFLECLVDIGQLSDYNTAQKVALLTKAKTALNESNVCNIPVGDVASLGSILTSLSTDEINCLLVNDISLMTSMGGISGWSTSQLDAIATRYVSLNSLTDLSGITQSDITMLGSVLCGFNTSQIATIPSVEIGKSGTVVGALMCDVAILSEFAKLAVAVDAFGPVSGWDAAKVTELNNLIAGLTGAEIATLTVSALEGLNAAVIPKIPASVFKEMSITQLGSLTLDQAKAISSDQLGQLSEEQKASLKTNSGSANVVFSTIHIALALFGAMVFTTAM